MKIKSDIRYYKSQMMIYLKNDARLRDVHQESAIAEAETIISEQGLSLQKAYIAKAMVLSGMKRVNNSNRLTKYLYIHFSDSFTAERLMQEMTVKNKNSSNKQSPEVFSHIL
jgi:hypothetical protein